VTTTRQRRRTELALPERVVLGRIGVDRLVTAAVDRQVGLSVAFEIGRADAHAARDGVLEDGGAHDLATPRDVSRSAHVHREDPHRRSIAPGPRGSKILRAVRARGELASDAP
jgi:hypothetical protein